MKEILLEGLSKSVEEATIQTWFVEEGDPVTEGDNLVELSSEEGTVTITAPVSGILAEVYYDEGESVSKGEILCTVDDEESDDDDEDEEDDLEEEEDEEDEEEDEEEGAGRKAADDDDEDEDEEEEEE
jgi:pyruvate/2-oxoglutarate dehydrogenase complex dihydrolipoamide acyltransferase (E2) component